jgi:hypothetical protein
VHNFLTHLPINLGNGVPVLVLLLAVLALMAVRVFQALFLRATANDLHRSDLWTLGVLVLFVVFVALRFLTYA